MVITFEVYERQQEIDFLMIHSNTFPDQYNSSTTVKDRPDSICLTIDGGVWEVNRLLWTAPAFMFDDRSVLLCFKILVSYLTLLYRFYS